MTYKKKLIEVALPLEAINKESAREKSIRHGHPSTLHLWWARRPLAACRAVLFASLVDDPSSLPEEFPTEEAQQKERDRLFKIIEDLVKWENINNKDVLDAAKCEIMKSTGGNPPPVLDPFCGGGSIPLEAQRLGLKAYASDLNPVAVLITKALIEIPPKFAGQPPVNPKDNKKKLPGMGWEGAKGLAADVRYYGEWMRDEAEKKIGHLYPKVKLPNEQGGGEATVIAWIWARTVASPDPSCRGAHTPLVRSFWLSSKKGLESYVAIVKNRSALSYSFKVKYGIPNDRDEVDRGTRATKKATFRCIFSDTPIEADYIRSEGKAGRIGLQLMAVVAEGPKQQLFASPGADHAIIATSARPTWLPDQTLPDAPRYIAPPLYGFKTYADLFTPRQAMALGVFSDLVSTVRKTILSDAKRLGITDDGRGIETGAMGATAYADAVATYLAFAVDRSANYWSTLTPWGGGFIVQTFGRQALPMVWDFAEANPLSTSTGNWRGAVTWITKCIEVAVPAAGFGRCSQRDARAAIDGEGDSIVATDPPYYDNIGYADLSDYFYVWLRRSIGDRYPQLFSTLLTPKAEELIASPYRHRGESLEAEKFFEAGLRAAFMKMQQHHNSGYPMTLFYAFRQAESGEDGVASTGWETMLHGLLKSGFAITGTWPIRSERDQGLKTGTNALASSVVLVCRPREASAGLTTLRELLAELKRELPSAIRGLQQGNIAPVDLAQAAIGPGMAVFSKYSKVIEPTGNPMSVRAALVLINQALDEALAEQESEFDADTRFALAWFEQQGMEEGLYDQGLVLSRAKNTSIDGMVQAGFLAAKAGKVRLLKRSELPKDWDPAKDNRLTVWEVAQHLVKFLDDGGEAEAAALARKVGALAETARDLAYRLYTICERRKWAQEGLAYNSLVVAWPEIQRLAKGTPQAAPGEQLKTGM